MGLFTALLTLPVTPVRAVTWVSQRVLDQAAAQQPGPAQIYARLAEIDEARAAGEISEEEAEAAESELVTVLMRPYAVSDGAAE